MTENYKMMAECIKDAQILLKTMSMHVSDEMKTEVAVALFKARRWKK